MEIVYVHVHVSMDGMMDGCLYVCRSVHVHYCYYDTVMYGMLALL